jgi:hypothetical protein
MLTIQEASLSTQTQDRLGLTAERGALEDLVSETLRRGLRSAAASVLTRVTSNSKLSEIFPTVPCHACIKRKVPEH